MFYLFIFIPFYCALIPCYYGDNEMFSDSLINATFKLFLLFHYLNYNKKKQKMIVLQKMKTMIVKMTRNMPC